MKNFNELFEQAKKTADRRKKVFNELIEKTQKEILPKFCESCNSLDIKRVYFKTNNIIILENDSSLVNVGGQELVYITALDVKNQEIQDAKYSDFDGYYIPDHWNMISISEIKMSRTGIVEFVKLLNSRLEDYIKKYDQKNEEAKSLI